MNDAGEASTGLEVRQGKYPARGLRGRVLRAGTWTILGDFTSQVVRLASNIIMTHLLAPEMFGIMSVANVIIFGFAMISDLGIGQSIIQNKRGEDPRFLNTAWSLQIIRGAILFVLTILSGIAIYAGIELSLFSPDSTYCDRNLPVVVVALSSTALIMGFESTKIPYLKRKLMLGRITAIDLCSQAFAFLGMLIWTRFDRSVWVLVSGSIISYAIRMILSHALLPGPPNKPEFEKEAFNEIFGFGKWIFLSSIIGFLVSSGDRLILGGLVDAATLGVYSIAFMMVASLQQVIQKLINNISYPLLSEVVRERPEELKPTYYKIRIFVDVAVLFICGFLAFSGHIFVDLLYDGRYKAAGAILDILAVSFFEVRYGVTGNVYFAKGISKLSIPLIGCRLLPLYVLLPIAYRLFGYECALWVIATNSFFSIPITLYFKKKYGILDPKKEIVVLPALLAGAAVGIAAAFAFR